MLQTTGDYLAKPSSGNLPKSTLNYKRLTDLNEASRKEGYIINVVQFSPYIPMALVAGQSGTEKGAASLFQVRFGMHLYLTSYTLLAHFIGDFFFASDHSVSLSCLV